MSTKIDRRLSRLEDRLNVEDTHRARRLQLAFDLGRLGLVDGRYVAHDPHLVRVAELLNLAAARRRAAREGRRV